MAAVKERTHIHRVDCIPTAVDGQYSLWLYGRQLVPRTAQPMVDAKERLQRLGYTGYVQLWSVDQPHLLRVEPLH
jgi:hypothetical protein